MYNYWKEIRKTTLTTAVNDEYVDANEVANIKEFGDLTLHNSDIMKDTADSLLRYYKLRKEIKLKYIIEKSKAVTGWLLITSEVNQQHHWLKASLLILWEVSYQQQHAADIRLLLPIMHLLVQSYTREVIICESKSNYSVSDH